MRQAVGVTDCLMKTPKLGLRNAVLHRQRRRDDDAAQLAVSAGMQIPVVPSMMQSEVSEKQRGKLSRTSECTAFANLGDTCYFNALLQALLHASPASGEIIRRLGGGHSY